MPVLPTNISETLLHKLLSTSLPANKTALQFSLLFTTIALGIALLPLYRLKLSWPSILATRGQVEGLDTSILSHSSGGLSSL